jgi:hypothetical protein
MVSTNWVRNKCEHRLSGKILSILTFYDEKLTKFRLVIGAPLI